MPKRQWLNVGTTTIEITDGDTAKTVKPGETYSGDPPRFFVRNGSLRRKRRKKATK